MTKEKIIIVAESLNDWEKKEPLNEELLTEGVRKTLSRFINKPVKKSLLTGAFAHQLGKVKGLKAALLKLDDETQINLAKQAYAALEKNPKLMYPKLKIEGNKIVSAYAVPGSRGQNPAAGE